METKGAEGGTTRFARRGNGGPAWPLDLASVHQHMSCDQRDVWESPVAPSS